MDITSIVEAAAIAETISESVLDWFHNQQLEPAVPPEAISEDVLDWLHDSTKPAYQGKRAKLAVAGVISKAVSKSDLYRLQGALKPADEGEQADN